MVQTVFFGHTAGLELRAELRAELQHQSSMLIPEQTLEQEKASKSIITSYRRDTFLQPSVGGQCLQLAMGHRSEFMLVLALWGG